MKQYILKLSLALLCMCCVGTVTAQDDNDSTKVELIDLPFTKVTENRLVGAVDVITSEDISHSALPYVSSAINGQAMGYVLGRIRGNSRGGNDAPLIVIDGLTNRMLESLSIDEVESVTVLKDVTAKMLYGSRAANGVLLVKTKRGYDGKRKISFYGEYGHRIADEMPEYVGAAEYMKYRNQALTNDKKDILFSDEEIGLAGSSYKYPDVDYHDTFIDDSKSFQRVNAQLVGGDEKTKYFFNLGWLGEEGLEKVGDKSKTNTLNVRSNLDYKVNDIISVNLDIAGRFFLSEGNFVGNGVFSEASSRKPNDYPIFISDKPHVDSLGTSDIVNGGNLYGDMVYSGYQRQEVSLAQTNLGMDFDLNKYVDGLTARAYANFDINNVISEGKYLTYRTLKPALTGAGEDTLIVNGVYNPKGEEQKIYDSYYRNMGGGVYVNYDKTFGDHAVSALVSYVADTKTVKTVAAEMTTVQDDKSKNLGFRLNYAYQDKYIAEVTSSYMGSSRYHSDNNWKLYNAFGVSYILSEEDFMSNVSFIDYLKLKASFGTIGYDQSFDYLLYNNYYNYWAGNYPTGVKNAGKLVGTQFSQSGNLDLSFEESKEMNIGLSMRVLKNKLSIDAEYFTEERSGMPTTMRYAIPGVAGTPTIVANYNAIDTKGFEIALQYSDRAGDFFYSFGGTLTNAESTWKQYDELNQFAFQNRTGTATDAMWGYVSDGFYTSQDDIANYGMRDGVPLTSAIGTVIQPGDLKYKDISNGRGDYNLDDNVINQYDRQIIGNTRPRYVYSFNVDLHYKNLSLYAMGQLYTGFDRMYNGDYFGNQGNAKYSKFASEAAVPTGFDAEGNAAGLESNNFTLPRLSSEWGHSYAGSDFWKKDGTFFKLRTVELNYKMPKSIVSKIAAQSLDFYVRGDNLLTIAEMKDVDPESPNAGFSSQPRYATVSLGLKLGF